MSSKTTGRTGENQVFEYLICFQTVDRGQTDAANYSRLIFAIDHESQSERLIRFIE